MKFIDHAFQALPIRPSEHTVDAALDDIGNPLNQPVYFHCKLGRDRTGMIAALYRVIYQGWSPADAHAEWERFGFEDPFAFRGLERYFDEHVDPILYWRRHPVLARIPNFSAVKGCASTPNARGGKDVVCKLGGETVSAVELMRRFASAQ